MSSCQQDGSGCTGDGSARALEMVGDLGRRYDLGCVRVLGGVAVGMLERLIGAAALGRPSVRVPVGDLLGELDRELGEWGDAEGRTSASASASEEKVSVVVLSEIATIYLFYCMWLTLQDGDGDIKMPDAPR